MTHNKTIVEVIHTRKTLEGAGVRLHRGFANAEVPKFDPFLLFDDFSGEDPDDYIKGFPWHPHRGIETITYMLHGEVRHHDSAGHSGEIRGGDVQWMTAGSGIMHEEMPQGIHGIQGFQLWLNLPQKSKMTDPKYRDVLKKDIPSTAVGKSATVKVIAGELGNIIGPVKDVKAEPIYLDVQIKPHGEFKFEIPFDYNTFCFVISGAIGTSDDEKVSYGKDNIVLFSRTGSQLSLKSGVNGAHILLMSGRPLNEPISWYGPIVMNSRAEIETAYNELQTGEFIKKN
ncbi:MAG: pirin family protein [Candidatus Peregrinibacteria bacterium]|nr:pirin family protein [Candidatus Peregrinibacteria bacterium]